MLQLLFVISLLSCSILLQACNETPTPSPTPTPAPADNITKVDTVLLEMFVKYNTTQGTVQDKEKAAGDYAKQQGWINSKDELTFEIEVDDASYYNPVKDKITSMGGRVMDKGSTNSDIPLTKMRVAVPENTFISYLNSTSHDNFLRDLASFKGVKTVNVISTRQTSDLHKLPQNPQALAALAVQTKNQGVKIMGVDAWQAAGYTGKGVKIGVIDAGYKYYKQFLGTTLPINLQIRDQDLEDGGDGYLEADVHGTAVLEIIHSVAPDATLYPVAVDGSEEEETEAFDYLESQGVQIISMSMGGHVTPGDGTLIENQRVDRLRAHNILPIFAAGNEGDSHYAGVFNPDAQGYQQFEPGVIKMAIGNPSSISDSTEVLLNWEQWHLPKDTKPTDLDLIIEDRNGQPIFSSQNDQRSRPPYELLHLKIPAKTLYYVKVRLKPGTPLNTQPFRLHIFTHDIPVQFDVPAMSVGAPADSKGALGVGAVQFDKDVIAYYSSRGPLPDGRLKPDIAGPAGVSSAAYAVEEGNDNAFDGTSAATPEVSGVAAVLKSANPGLTADQLAELLKEYTKKIGNSKNPDDTYGYGRLDLTNVKPGDANPKNDLGATSTPNNNPVLTPTIYVYYPTPIVSPVPTKANQPTATIAPTITPQPGPTSTAIPSPQPIGPVSFKDTFNDDTSGLPNSNSTIYGHNLYEIKPESGQLAWGVYPTSLNVSDFAAQVMAKGINDKNGVYGLIFWANNPNDYFMLSITGDGKASVQQFNGGNWKSIIDWTTAPGWKAGTINKIGITANNGTITIVVNDVAIKNGQGQGTGSIGFAAGSYNGSADATFQNFTLITNK